MARMLESEEAARRLGVKPATLYAYVSRGRLHAHRAPGGRRSLFDVEEVEALVRRARGGRRVESRLATVTTAVTQIRDDGPAYRGRPVVDLVGRTTYEEAAEILWGGDGTAGVAWAPWPVGTPPVAGPADRLRWALVMAGALDPVRSDLRPEAVVRAARRTIATLTSVLGAPSGPTGRSPGGAPRAPAAAGRPRAGPVAGALTAHLLGSGAGAGTDAEAGAPAAALVAPVVDGALVLLADHELATSTLAVRVAASTRSDLYDALLAGLGTLAGPLHGGASRAAHALLADAERVGATAAVDEALRWQGSLPGFGHPLYGAGDRRASTLLAAVRPLVRADRWAVTQEVVDLAAAEELPHPNVDLGLAALSWGAGMAPEAGRTIFTIARLAGWVAHYLEELGERPLRFRARAVYATPT